MGVKLERERVSVEDKWNRYTPSSRPTSIVHPHPLPAYISANERELMVTFLSSLGYEMPTDETLPLTIPQQCECSLPFLLCTMHVEQRPPSHLNSYNIILVDSGEERGGGSDRQTGITLSCSLSTDFTIQKRSASCLYSYSFCEIPTSLPETFFDTRA